MPGPQARLRAVDFFALDLVAAVFFAADVPPDFAAVFFAGVFFAALLRAGDFFAAEPRAGAAPSPFFSPDAASTLRCSAATRSSTSAAQRRGRGTAGSG